MTTLTRTQTRTNIQVQTGLDSLSKSSVVAMGALSALIGLWAATCFVGALIGGGGQLSLVQSWVSAISGI